MQVAQYTEWTERDEEDCLVIYSLLHSADPTIIGFEIIEVNPDTSEWVCRVFYPDSEEGMVWGKGAIITRMAGGAKYDIVSRREAIRRMEADPEYAMDSFLEPRE